MESFEVSYENLNFNICLLPLEEIYLHEEIIPELVRKLSRDIKAANVLRNPIIVENRHYVVLDGNHRAAALRSLRCLRIAACKLNYFNDQIKLGRWFRVFKCDDFKNKIKRVLKKIEVDFSEAPVSEIKEILDNENVICGLLWKKNGLKIFGEDSNVADKLKIVKNIESKLQKLGCWIEYDTENDALNKLSQDLTDGVLALPHIKKEDVVNCALMNHRFPRKTTRHVIPARPWNVNVPLTILQRTDLKIEQANRLFINLLRKKQIKLIPPRSTLNGRKYEEELYEFVDR